MLMAIRSSTFLSLSAIFAAVAVTAQNSNISTPALTGRYWDCCKPSCGWSSKASFNNDSPVGTCDANNRPLNDFNAGTGCNGGTAYTCSDQSPWAVNDTFSYGFAGAFIKGGTEGSWCCSCYQLNFTSGSVAGKTMIVQATNTDYDILGDNMFTLAIPGGNNSFGACPRQYGIDQTVFGQGLSGVSSRDQCSQLPEAQQSGCFWRFDWFQDADRPNVNFRRVTCPTALTNRTGCSRTDDTTFVEKAQTGAASAVGSRSISPLLCTGLVVFVFSWFLT